MELRHLRSFIAVAEELNFRRAAIRLHMAQPPLSQQIKRLEREVGATLLGRTTRQVELTPAGTAFLQRARRAVAEADDAVRVARATASGHEGTLRLGVSGPTFYEVLVRITTSFRRIRPRVELEITGPLFGKELVELVMRSAVDAALVRLPVQGHGLAIRKITEHPVVAVLPTGHPLARRTELRIDDISTEPLVGYPSSRGAVTVHLVHKAFVEHGYSPNIVQEAPDTHTIMLLVAVGAGIGLVPVSAAHLQVPGIVLVPVIDMPPMPLALVWRQDDPNPVLAALITQLDDVVAQLSEDRCVAPDAAVTPGQSTAPPST